MNETSFILLKMIAGSGVMYLGYRMWLINNQSVGLMRWYLLASFVVPVILPLINLSDWMPGRDFPVVRVAIMPEVVVDGVGGAEIESARPLYFWLYLAVGSVLLLLFISRLVQIFGLILKSKLVIYYYLKLHLSRANLTPFSFFNNILVSVHQVKRGNLRPIIIHEVAHIKQGHSYDILFIEIMSILLWFNPFVWLFRKAVRQNHEFLADRAVVMQHCNPANYKALLLESLTGISVPVVNNFNHSSLKKRFIMLNKPFSGRGAYLRALAGVTFLFVMVTAMTTMFQKESFAMADALGIQPAPGNTVTAPAALAVASNSTTTPQKDDDKEVFMVVEQMPEFPGGNEALSKYLAKNVVFPDEARKKGIVGTVYVSYVVEADGSVSMAKVERGIGHGCDEAALKAVSGMPKWKPGSQRGKAVRVSMTVPIKFQLADEKLEKQGTPDQMKPNEKGVFSVVETMPQFPGGEEARIKYMRDNITYPEGARKAGKEGTVYVTFVVQEDGSITDAKVLRGIDKECDEVALKMIKNMPAWKPGLQKGQPVKVQFNMPVKFALSKEKVK